MADLYFMSPDEICSYGATVTTSAGTTDTDYTDDWICDTRPGRPARATTGTVTWNTSFSSAEVGMLVLANCYSSVNATITGGVSTTIPLGTLQGNGIRLNGFTTVTPASMTGLNVGFSGSSDDVILGEFIFGKYRTLTRPIISDDSTDLTDLARTQDMDLSSIPPFDPGLVARTWSGAYLVTNANRLVIENWYLSQRGATRPSVIVPIPSVNDAMVGFLRPPSYRPAPKPDYWYVSLSFVEIPRVRWV